MATLRNADLVGRVLGGRYRLLRPEGRGTSATVYEADDVKLRRKVAVKVLDEYLAGEQAFLRRFAAEADAAARLEHPHIVPLYDRGQDGELPYLVMKLYDGGPLWSMIGQGILLTPAQAAEVGADVAQALALAHREGIVHRDVKPANLLFDRAGSVAVADFGLARAISDAALTRQEGTVTGTARYGAPDQLEGPVTGRSDVYALGLVLIEALSGSVPLTADSEIATLDARRHRAVPVPEVAGPLRSVLEAVGQPRPVDRPDAAALAAELRAVGRRLPLPEPLPLVRPIDLGLMDRAERDPTEHPDRSRILALREQADLPPVPPAAAEPAGAARPVAPEPEEQEPTDGGPRPPGTGTGTGTVTSRRRRIAAAVAAGVLVAGGAGAAWAVVARPATTEPVPAVTGDTQAAAAAALARVHLKLAVSGSAYDSRVPAGGVVTQKPAGGRLREGSAVTVVLSEGPAPVPVPDLASDTQDAAQQVLTTLGLRWSVVPKPSLDVPAGTVISNAPDSGTLLPGSTVTLVVSSGKPKVAVPVLSGPSAASFAAAQAALSPVGLPAVESDQYSDTVPKGQVVGTNPPGAATVDVGTPVTVVVSLGPHLVTIPNVDGTSVGAATQQLTAAGLTVSGVSGNPLGTVVRTSPPAGTTVHIGASVQLVTG